MLALKQALSLVSTPILGTDWSPTDEVSLEAWYQNKEGLTFNGSDVSVWNDSSPNGADMQQASAGKQPAYNVVTGGLTFVSSARDFLQTGTQITLTDDFTIGIRIYPDITASGSFLGDNTETGEKFKITGNDTMSITIGGTVKNFSLNSGTWGDDYLVITRSSDLITFWQNGVQQFDTETISGICLIDAMAVRYNNVDNFDGVIQEIQFYSTSSAEITANVNARLSTL